MFKGAIFILILSSCTFVNGDVYSTCYPYNTYCLFSFGPNVTVKNVKEAQKICEDAKHGSWLLEIVDKKTLEKVKKFVTDHSFPKDANLILNAVKYGNEKWKWIKSHSDVADDIISEIRNGDGNVKVFRPLKETGPNVPRGYTVICMTGCPSKLMIHEGMRYVGATHNPSKNKEQCLEFCELLNCEAWEWERGYYYGCWIHQQIKGEMNSNPSGTLYAIDPFGKGYENCANNVSEPHFRDSTRKRERDSIALYICLSIILMTLITVAVIIFWRRRKKKSELQKHDLQKSVYASPVFSGLIDEVTPSSPSSSTSYYLETKQPGTNSSGLVYADLVHHPKQSKTKKKQSQKIGPMGDVYSQVKR